jgi:hypothetical protein
MPTLSANSHLIPYGTARLLPGTISVDQVSAESAVFECRTPYVLLDTERREPLRLNGDQYDFPESPPLRDFLETADQLDYLCEGLKRHCDLWRRNQKQFLDRYFDFVAAHVQDHRELLSQRLQAFGGLLNYSDWAFSALRPLPLAHLAAPSLSNDPNDKPGSPIRVDFAFWNGESLIAIDIIGSETRGPKAVERRKRLYRAGILVIDVPDILLGPNRGADFATALPDVFLKFWEGEFLPSGPIKPATLATIRRSGAGS